MSCGIVYLNAAGGYWATDCPLCDPPQEVRVDVHGDKVRLADRGLHTHDQLAGVLDPRAILELVSRARANGHAPAARADWLDGAPMDPVAVAADPLPTVPGFPFLHPATAAVVSGPTGAGRSSLVQAGAYDAARHGQRVAYLGSEVTQPEFNARAADLAARRGDEADDALRADLARVRYLTLASVLAEAWQHPGDWAATVAARYDLVLIDPLSAVASTLELDFDKSNADFVRFYDKLIQPIVDAGVAVIMLENIGHATEARNRAKGASAKQDRADLTFSCSLQANPVGLAITSRKVRTVRAAFGRGDRWIFDRDCQQITREDAGPDDVWRPTHLMEKVSRLLEEQGALGRNKIRSGVGSKTDHVDAAIAALEHDGHLTIERDGQRKLHQLQMPYREPGPTGTQPGPGPGVATGTHRVPHPVGVGPVEVPVPTAPADGQLGPDEAQAELDRLTAKFGQPEPAA